MKKGLSILLIAAALFGFYGAAVNLNDVLACKDYWEEEGERTTADMNKLEDGLNQLKENEMAYLDGAEQIADGEIALEEGEAKLADGRATLAKGEADYAAAPAKLAAGEKALAEGKEKLAAGKKELAAGKKELKAGKKSLSDLDTLINGLKKARSGFNKQWNPGFEKKATKSDYSDAGLKQAREVIVGTLNSKKDDFKLIEKLSGKSNLIDKYVNAKSYKAFDGAVSNPKELFDAFDAAKKSLQTFANIASSNASNPELTAAAQVIGMTTAERTAKDKQIGQGIASAQEGIAKCEETIEQLEALGEENWSDEQKATYDAQKSKKGELEATIKELKTSQYKINHPEVIRAQVAQQVGGLKSSLGDKLSLVGALDKDLYDAIDGNLTTIIDNSDSTSNDDFAKAIGNLGSNLNTLAAALKGKIGEIDENKKTLKTTFAKWHKGYEQLKDGQEELGSTTSGVPYAFSKMTSNATIRKALKKSAPGMIAKLSLLTGPDMLTEDMDKFNGDMKDAVKLIDKVLPILYGVRAEGKKTAAAGEKALAKGQRDLAKGKKDLAAGKAELAKGYADYAAAPAKLAAGRAQLAAGEQELMDGRKELADGREKLAEYEDGEQQVRDGLATLMATTPDGGLTSILDRRNGDADFDNGDDHLELDEGLDAVNVGRGYQSDSGVLITKEITGRAVGTAAAIGAGALAILAAILSFLKKYKGAGVCAILSAIAGGAGIAYGTSAGMEFSNIAGSHAGSMPWVAAGVLAAVAAVHAIAHFTAKKA